MENKIIPFAITNFRNHSKVFGIKTNDRRNHVYVVGKTGTGKTTLLRNMMISDIQAGHGVAVVDPHGEFAESILDYVPESRIDDVVYFNPADLDFPIAFNAVEKVDISERHLVSSGLIGIFKKIWADSWGPRLEYVLRNAILALLEQPDSTLLGVMRMLSDKEYRKQVVANTSDPVVRQFWTEEFAKYSSKFEVEAVAPIQNKVGQFLTNPMIRNIVGQVKSSMHMREIMDSKKILILNLSKGRIGEDSSALMGAMLITKIQQAAMSRINVPEEERSDFYLYVDEFQNFATESFAGILSEARKYRLDLTLAHQYVTQLDETVRDAVLGNAGTLITFRIGADDAEFFEKEYAPEITALDLVNLPNQKIYLKLMIDGVTSKAFSADTLAPIPKQEQSFKEEIIRRSRQRYGSSRTDVEQAISQWSLPVAIPAFIPGPAGSAIPHRAESLQTGDKKLYDAVCSNCGNPTKVPFEPDPKRKIFCKNCLPNIVKAKQEAVVASPVASAPEVHKVRKGPDLTGLRSVLNRSLDAAQAQNVKKAILEKKMQEQNMKMEDITKF